MKHQWRKAEKQYYLPKSEPVCVDIPRFQFITIKGHGDPNGKVFAEKTAALYAVAYKVKMTLKQLRPEADYTVYPLEGVWDIAPEARGDDVLDKAMLTYQLMIRQPDVIVADDVIAAKALVKQKKQLAFIDDVVFQSHLEGTVVQMLHRGSYDDEAASFARMKQFMVAHDYQLVSPAHREIYLTDPRRTAPDKCQTVLRYRVQKITNTP